MVEREGDAARRRRPSPPPDTRKRPSLTARAFLSSSSSLVSLYCESSVMYVFHSRCCCFARGFALAGLPRLFGGRFDGRGRWPGLAPCAGWPSAPAKSACASANKRPTSIRQKWRARVCAVCDVRGCGVPRGFQLGWPPRDFETECLWQKVRCPRISRCHTTAVERKFPRPDFL